MEVVPEESEEGMVCSACDLKMWRCWWWNSVNGDDSGGDDDDDNGDDDDRDVYEVLIWL